VRRFHVFKTLLLGNLITGHCCGSLSVSFRFLSSIFHRCPSQSRLLIHPVSNFYACRFNTDAISAQSIYTCMHTGTNTHTQRAQSFTLSVIRGAELTQNKSFFHRRGLLRNKEPVCKCFWCVCARWSINIFLVQIIHLPCITGITFQHKHRQAIAKSNFSPLTQESVKSEILACHCSDKALHCCQLETSLKSKPRTGINPVKATRIRNTSLI